MGLRSSQKPRSLSINKEGTGQPQGDSWAGVCRDRPGGSSFFLPAGCGIPSGPAETRDRLPLLLPLELLVGSIQVLQHLQQAGRCFSLPGQSVGAGPWAGDKGAPRSLARAGQAARTHTPWLSQAPDLPCAGRILRGTSTPTHTHSLGPAGGHQSRGCVQGVGDVRA